VRISSIASPDFDANAFYSSVILQVKAAQIVVSDKYRVRSLLLLYSVSSVSDASIDGIYAPLSASSAHSTR
jgi:hypothetical protein